MSTTERRIPGERLLRRILERGTVRPSVGTPASFYERLGLDDPWAEQGFVASDASELASDGLFSFLSADPYYRTLRAQSFWRSRHARRRLLGRLDADSHVGMDLAGRMSRAVDLGSAWVRRSRDVWADSAMVTPEAPPSREAIVAELEAEGWAPRGAPRSVERTARRRAASSRALRRQAAQVAPALQGTLDALEAAASPRARRALRLVVEEIAALPEADQAIVLQRITRRAGGALARVARVQALEIGAEADARPLGVAVDRAVGFAGRRAGHRAKGLRPVTHGSPSMMTLAAVTASEEAPAALAVPRQRPVDAPRPVAAVPRRRESAPVVREARTQHAAGRAGPVDSTAPQRAARTPATAIAPTAWVARLARAADPAATVSVAHGLDAVRESMPAARRGRMARAVARATLPPAGAPLSASPAGYIAAERAVAADRGALAGVAWSGDSGEPAARGSGSRRASVPETRSRRSRAVIGSPSALAIPEPLTVDAEPALRAADRPTLRAARRAAADPARAARRVLAGPVVETEPGAVARHAAAFPALQPGGAPRVRRPSLSASPTSYLSPAEEPFAAEIVEARPSVASRAVARAEQPAARVDLAGRALLTATPTDYVRESRVLERASIPRARRLDTVATDAVIRPEALDAEVPASGFARSAASGVAAGTPAPGTAARAARRAEAGQVAAVVDSPRVRRVVRKPVEGGDTAHTSTVDAPPAARAASRRPVVVRGVEGQIERRATVASGSVVYAAARLEGEAPVDAAAAVTPLARRARRSRRPVAYADASRDFSWLVPDAAGVGEIAEPGASPGGAPRVRIEATRPLSRADLARVIERVSTVVRAIEREADARAVIPATRRALAAAGVDTFGEAAQAPVERLAARAAAATGRRRALRAPDGTLVAPADAPSPAEAVATAEARLEGRERLTAAAQPRVRTARRADGAVVAAAPGRGAAGVARALGSTLGALGEDALDPRADAPRALRRRAVQARRGGAVHVDPSPAWARRAMDGTGSSVGPARRPSPAADAVLAAEPGPGGAGLPGAPGALVDARGQAIKPRPGGIFSALARASTADDVVRVILERADGLRGLGSELPEPAVKLVERIVRIQDEAIAATANVVAPDQLEPLNPPRVEASAAPRGSTARSSRSMWSGGRTLPARRTDGAGASNAMKLANKLMGLIHLAEHERKLAEAQRYVRMAQEDGKVESGKEPASGEAVEAPNLKALQREVFDAVLREIELTKQRRQEDFDVSVWW